MYKDDPITLEWTDTVAVRSNEIGNLVGCWEQDKIKRWLPAHGQCNDPHLYCLHDFLFNELNPHKTLFMIPFILLSSQCNNNTLSLTCVF